MWKILGGCGHQCVEDPDINCGICFTRDSGEVVAHPQQLSELNTELLAYFFFPSIELDSKNTEKLKFLKLWFERREGSLY